MVVLVVQIASFSIILLYNCNMKKINESIELQAESFNIYYLNFLKTYEISMMIDNEVISSRIKEKTNEFSNTKTTTLDGKLSYLAQASASINQSKTSVQNAVSKIIETFEVKTTKSRLLDKIINKCIKVTSCNDIKEGQLVKIDEIQLQILNEENLRQIIVLKGDTLKGMNVEGIQISNIVSSMLQDYAYLLYAKLNSGEKIIIKIPLDLQSEFENKYSINDLLIGKVSIIGIYKSLVDEETINMNTFNYLTEIGAKTDTQGKIIKSSSIEIKSKDNKNIKEKYYYIDLIAIIQDVYYQKGKPIKKRWGWLSKFKGWFWKK